MFDAVTVPLLQLLPSSGTQQLGGFASCAWAALPQNTSKSQAGWRYHLGGAGRETEELF